jgi:gliding motility-associated-like protein
LTKKVLFILFLCAFSHEARTQCLNSFRLTLSGRQTEFGFDIVQIAGGDMIIAGQTTSFGAGGADIFLTRMTSAGVIVWSKTYGGPGDEQLRKIRLSLDGNILLTGSTKSYGNTQGAALAMEIDPNGNILWSAQFQESTGYSLGLDILATTDNGFLVSGSDYAPDASSDWLVAKLDASGNLVWTTRLNYATNEDAFSMIQKGDTVIVSGDENDNAFGDYSGVIVKLNLANGSLYSSQAYIIDGRGPFYSRIQSSGNQYRIMVHIIDEYSYAQMQEGFIITDQIFDPVSSFKINASPYDNNYYTGFYQTADGGFLATGSPTGSTQGYLFKFDPSGNLTFTTQLSSSNSFSVYSATQASDGTYWAVGSDNNHVSVIKLNSSGQFDYCPNSNPLVPIVPASLVFSPFTWSNISTYNFLPPSIAPASSAFTFTIDSLCYAPVCHIRLTAPDTICQNNDTTTVRASRTGDCGTSILWSVPSGAYSQPIDDSTIRVHFSADGSYSILAAGTDPCSPSQDSLQLVTQYSPASINLGPDTVLCNGGDLLLNAGSGFVTYQWQDFSANPTYQATHTGQYYVSATNLCHQTFTDTISVAIRTADSFSVYPADTSFCKQGPVSFTAQGGDTYNWSPATGLNNTGISDPTALIDSSIDYQLLVTDTLCHRSHQFTVSITIDPPPILSLSKSNDLDCSVGSAQLQVTGGVSYIWSPVSSLNNDTIGNPVASPTATTTYYIQGSNAIGCSTTDSITVYFTKEGEANFYLPNAFTPNNDGHNDVFRIIVRGSVQLGRFSVFDRWGQIVFSTTNISQGWDGTYRGSVLPAGTYVWEVSASTPCTGPMFQKGVIMLIR